MATFNGDFSSVSAIKVPDANGTRRDVFQIKSDTTGKILWRKNITYRYTYNLNAILLGFGSFALYYDKSCTKSVTPTITNLGSSSRTYSYTVPYGTPVYWRLTTNTGLYDYYHFETNGTDHTNPKNVVISYNYKSTGADYTNTTTLSIPNLVKDWLSLNFSLLYSNYGTIKGTNNGVTRIITSGSDYWVQYNDTPKITVTADTSKGYYFEDSSYGTAFSRGCYADKLSAAVTPIDYDGNHAVTTSGSKKFSNHRYITIVQSSYWRHPLDNDLISDSNMNLRITWSSYGTESISLSEGTFRSYAINATYSSTAVTITGEYVLNSNYLSFDKIATRKSSYSVFSFSTSSTALTQSYGSSYPSVYAWGCLRVYAYGGGSANNGGSRSVQMVALNSSFSYTLTYIGVVIRANNGDWNTTVDGGNRYPYLVTGSSSLSTSKYLVQHNGFTDWFISVKMGYFETCASSIKSVGTGYSGSSSATKCIITCTNTSPENDSVSTYKFPTVTTYTLNFGVSWCYENFSSDSQRSRVPASDSYPDNDYAQIYSSSYGTSTDRDVRNPNYGSNGTNGTAKSRDYQYTNSNQNTRYVYSNILLGT